MSAPAAAATASRAATSTFFQRLRAPPRPPPRRGQSKPAEPRPPPGPRAASPVRRGEVEQSPRIFPEKGEWITSRLYEISSSKPFRKSSNLLHTSE
ncbi:Structural Maintenance Of Chromosomes Protein 4 [Manis pentadactyla]|nr:Structural Maintenance Of Chromosomes Protein 4 [Manis pentadactyla]